MSHKLQAYALLESSCWKQKSLTMSGFLMGLSKDQTCKLVTSL